jgi:two-component system chemotaxis sensor kinase CheA
LFRAVHTIKGNTGVLLGMIKGAPIAATHPLQQLLLVAHGLESLLEAFRVPGGAPVSAEAIQTALESRDAIRALLGSLMHGGGAGGVPVALLARLGVPAAPAPRVSSVDGHAAFRNTASQCAEVIAGCVRRMNDDAALSGPVLGTYLRGLKTWLAAARYQNYPEMEAPLVQQLRMLEAAAADGAVIGPDQRRALGDAFSAAQSLLAHVLAADGAAPPPATITADPVGASGAPTTVRIDQNKLDGLMRIVGELLVARGTFPLLIRSMTAGADSAGTMRDLKDTGSRISRIADELQSSVMSIRMLPIKTVFQRFPRLVRDLARSLGKDVRLVIEGEDTEVDKAIIDQIGDPLMHVIRNALDHGLESPEERRAQGKDGSGQLTLRAVRETGGVVIEVTEDGRGLDVEALKRKAVAGGVITPEAAAAMSEDPAFQLIFLPGLTTAAVVTDVSGRGVGMDVVRSSVRSLHGTIDIRSQPGRGTTFAIRLPASLLISKGILVEAGAQEYILPLVNIRDMVRLPPHAAHEYLGLTLAQVRGTTYSLVNLAERLSLTPATMPEISVALVEAGAATYGLVVDRFLTEVEVLVKPLTGGLEHCREFQGAAIMGDGRVVLVLNALECHGTSRSYAVN